jgi:hypothetical protein
MLLGRDPKMSVTPSAEVSQFLYLDMVMLDVVLDRETYRIVDSHVAAESKQNARDLECQKFRVRSRFNLLETDGYTPSTPQNLLGRRVDVPLPQTAKENQYL